MIERLCRRFVLSGCFLFAVMHSESAVKSNAILIGKVDDSNSFVVNVNFLFSETAALVRSVYSQKDGRSKFVPEYPSSTK